MKLILQAFVAALLVLARGAEARPRLAIVLFEEPSDAVVQALAVTTLVDVRWVEQGLIVAEAPDPSSLPSSWGGRVVGEREPEQALALLRARDVRLLQEDATGARILAGLRASRRGTARARAGDLWVLVAPPASWPRELLGCHGGLLLPPHRIDPRSLLEAVPPALLCPGGGSPARKLSRWERALVADISEDSIAASMAALTRDPSLQLAERHVFGRDLDGLYSPRVEASMQRYLQGIPGADVRRESFAKSRVCDGEVVVDSTYNVVARLPGTVPGTGIFVVCAHIDATGSRNADWSAARNACQELSATPGAEDNATGVAAMLEVLRCASEGVRQGSLDFAFDVEFIAFSGEEAEGQQGGLTGSRDYVQARLEEGSKLLGAFNLDMVGSDSLGNRLQVVHNVGSQWLAEWLVAAAAATQPPIDLDLQLDLDESLASDHNSFWGANVPALLGADAPIDVLRRYASYHRPSDSGADVNQAKVAEVARAILAALLQFDRQEQTESILVFPEGLQLTIAPQGNDLPYDPNLYRVWPGSPLKARLPVYNAGAPYTASITVQMWLRCPPELEPNPSGRLIFECHDDSCFSRGGGARPLQTGDRLDFRVDPIPLDSQDRGECEVLALVDFEQGGRDSLQRFSAPLTVAEQRGLPLSLLPNPMRDPESARLEVSVERAGWLQLQLFDVAGRRVATQTTSVVPNFLQSSGTFVNVPLQLVPSGRSVPSGVYYLRIEWVGPGGERQSSVSRIVLVR